MNNFMNSENEFRFNEVLFENRNKQYGAYVIRNNEGSILTKSLLIGVAFFAAVAISPLIIKSFETPVTIITNDGGFIFQPVEVPEEPPVTVTPVSPPRVIESTVSLEVPTPTDKPLKETPATSISDIKDTRIGTENIEGPPLSFQKPPVFVPSVAVAPIGDTPKSVPGNTIVDKVDVEASFNGGINAFRNKVVQNFDADYFEGSGELIKTTITFVVEKDGTISAIKANGPDSAFNREAEKTIKNIKGKWAPAKLNGESVRSYFNFPISMKFE